MRTQTLPFFLAVSSLVACGRTQLFAPAASSSSDGDGSALGCSDGTREGFADLTMYPKIAGCSGGWSVPGILSPLSPTCDHLAGNDGPNPGGAGCSAADLCAFGFHVCKSEADVASRSPTGCAGVAAAPGLFFAAGQSSNGCAACALGDDLDPQICDGATCTPGCAQTTLTANDLFGCGSLGAASKNCGVLDRFSNNLCAALGPPWLCDDPQNSGYTEASVVTKGSSAGGGVLCCAD